MHLSDQQWAIIPQVILSPVKKDARGRPRRSSRSILDGILWILRTSAPWKDLPERYPPYQTCHRRFQEWCGNGTFEKILRLLAEDMQQRGRISLKECFIDGTFIKAKKGGYQLAIPDRAKAVKSWQFQTKSCLFKGQNGSRLLQKATLP